MLSALAVGIISSDALANAKNQKTVISGSEPFDWDFSGLGVMYSINDSVNQDEVDQFELYGLMRMPWQWQFEAAGGSQLSTELHTGGGRYQLTDDNFHYLIAGPVLRLQYTPWPLSLHIGSRFTLLSDSKAPLIDVGGRFHATSHIGVEYHIDRHWTLGVRFQHLSNAGTNKKNPGLDTYSLELRYDF